MPATNSAQSRLSAPGHGLGGNLKASYGEVAFSGTITTADSAALLNLPVGAIVMGGFIEADDLDTSGSPTITLNVGDAGDADRYFAASTVAQTGVAGTALAVTGLGCTVTEGNTAVRIAVAANAATSAAGNVRVGLFYILP